MKSPFHKTAPIEVKVVVCCWLAIVFIFATIAILNYFNVPAQTFAVIAWTLAGIVSLTRVIYFIVTGK